VCDKESGMHSILTCINVVQVELVLVVGSVVDARDAATAIKTIVHHRRVAPLQLHIFVTELTHHIMQTLLNTWPLSQGGVDNRTSAHLQQHNDVAFDLKLYKFANTSVNFTKRSFICASPRLWKQLTDSFRRPRQSCIDSPSHSLVSSSLLS